MECAGYKIISMIQAPDHWVVLGHNLSAVSPFVTWEYTLRSGYDWGHYFGTYREAVQDFCKRALNDLGITTSNEQSKAESIAEELKTCSVERAFNLGMNCESWEELEMVLKNYLATNYPWYDQQVRGEGG